MTPVQDVRFVLLCVSISVVITLAFGVDRVIKERNTIIKAHCDVIDVNTGIFKCANGKVYLLGVSE